MGVKMSRRETRKELAMEAINALPKGEQFCSYDLANTIAGDDERLKKNMRTFLSDFLKNLAVEGKTIRFVGWQESNAPIQKKVYQKV